MVVPATNNDGEDERNPFGWKGNKGFAKCSEQMAMVPRAVGLEDLDPKGQVMIRDIIFGKLILVGKV